MEGPRRGACLRMSRRGSAWVTQVRQPGWHPHDRRPHLQEEFNVRGKYKGTYAVHTALRAWPAPPSEDPKRRTDLLHALSVWRRRTRAVLPVRELVQSRWHGGCRRSFTRWSRVAAAQAVSLARLTRYKLRERERAAQSPGRVALDEAAYAVDQACIACAQHVAWCAHDTLAACA